MDKSARIFVAGHRGMVGSALVRRLREDGYTDILTRTHTELDLLDQKEVQRFFAAERVDVVLLAAARVGGILANATQPADFIYQNLAIETNVIHAAYQAGVTRLVFFGSSCIYPKNCPQPIEEEYLLSSPLEATNEPYAIAKIAGLKLCEAYNRQYGTKFVALMPTNLYGPNDNYDLRNSHVLPALIRKAHEAKLHGDSVLTVWGTGTPRRELLYADDLAQACCFLMSLDDERFSSLLVEDVPPLINIGTGEDVTIRELAETIARVLEFDGALTFDTGKPDGTPRKLLDVERLHRLGWRHSTGLEQGIRRTWEAVRGRLTSSSIPQK